MIKDDLTKAISTFFFEFLPKNSGLSDNTISSYRDTFVLFFCFYQDDTGRPANTLTFDDITYKNIESFLQWLEEKKNYSIASRNQRLAALHTFMKYIQREYPQYIFQCSEILGIRMKKCPQAKMSYLSVDAIRLLLSVPDSSTQNGQRDLTLLTLLYDSGARVQELI